MLYCIPDTQSDSMSTDGERELLRIHEVEGQSSLDNSGQVNRLYLTVYFWTPVDSTKRRLFANIKIKSECL